MRSLTRAVVLSVSMLLAGAAAGFPVTYQGVLRNAGAPVNGTVSVTVNLTDSPVGGLLLQSLVFPVVNVTDGLLNLELNFSDTHFSGGEDRWISVVVDGQTLSPRQRVTYAPYAIRSDTAREAGTVRVPVVLQGATVVLEAYASASGGTAVRGVHLANTGSAPAVLGQTNSTSASAAAVTGEVLSTSAGSFSAAVRGMNASTSGSGIGVYGSQEGSGWGVYGFAPGGRGVFGSASSGVGVYGNSTSGTAVQAQATTGIGLRATQFGAGTSAELANADFGVSAFNTSDPGEGTAIEGTGGHIGVRGVALPDGFGLLLQRIGVDGFAGGFSTGANQIYGVRGFGQAPAAGGSRNAYGVYGGAQSGTSGNTGYGVYGTSVGPGTNWAGYFQGNVHVMGTLSKSAGAFKIDHPMEPEKKYLSHSFVESPEMLNIYDGMATLDAEGRAVVELPRYFEALNTSFRYQLTAVGASMRDLHVSREVSGNRFEVAGGVPGGKVSWQVTGVRQDASAKYRPIVVEEDKLPHQIGKYLDPAAHGADASKGLFQGGNQ